MFEIIISTIITIPCVFYIWNNWSENKFSLKEKRTWIILIINLIFTIINYLNVISIIKIVNMTLIFIIVYKYLYNTKLKYSIIGPLMSQTIYFISELLFAIILITILKQNSSQLTHNYFGTIVANIGISFIALLISKFRFLKKLFIRFNKFASYFDEITVIFIACLLIFVYTVFAVNAYYKLDSNLLMTLSITIAIFAFVLVYMFFKTKDDYYKINDKYNNSIVNLKELEKVLSNQRIDNHENKNHLMTIRNMTSNKKIIKFIDSILDSKQKDNKNILHETGCIPEGGLRGLIYAKLLIMYEKKIDYELNVTNSIRILDMVEYGDDTVLDICKIVGIFLDNAIEEVETINDKYIVIEIFIDNNVLNILITNTYDNTKNKENIYKAGVSTKGGNHGYGLALVKKITKYNKKLKIYNEITEEEFTQILKVYK